MELKYILMVMSYQILGVVDEKYVDFIIKYNKVAQMPIGEINKLLVADYDMWVKKGG